MTLAERQRAAATRLNYPPGTRLELISMDNDPIPIPPGTRGTVLGVDDAGQVLMHWDNGRSLSHSRRGCFPEADPGRNLGRTVCGRYGMPNHVTNIIKFKGNADRFQELLERIQNEEYGRGSIDFNKIIPMPESLNIQSGSTIRLGLEAYQGFVEVYTLAGTRTGLDLLNIPKASEDAFLKMRPDIKPEEWALGKAAFQNIQQYGAPTWYEWCVQNWGTKWNAYDCNAALDANTMTFLTAWSAPHPILQKLSEMYPDIVMEHQWADGATRSLAKS